MSDALVDVVARMDQAFAGGLQSQVQWLEDAALALDKEDLGEDGARASTDFKAALGAILQWARGPKIPATLPELEGVVRAFLARGLLSIYRAIGATLRALADERTSQRAACLDLAIVFEGLATAQITGAAPSLDVLQRLQALRAAEDHR